MFVGRNELEPPSSGFASQDSGAAMEPVSGKSRRWPLELAAVAIAIVVVAALTLPHLLVRGSLSTPGGQPTPSVQPGVVPWSDVAAPNVASAFTKPGVPACTASALTIDVHALPSYIGRGPANTSFWTISVTNAGTSPCFVGPTMDVGFISADGPLPLTPQRWGGNIVYLAPSRKPSMPGFNDKAVGEIDTFPCAAPRIVQMTISPGPGLGVVKLDPGPAGGFGSPCPEKQQAYLVELMSDVNQIGYAAMTQTSIDAPAETHPGERLRFLVTIENRPTPRLSYGPDPSPSPLVFSPCPTYHLELEGEEGTFHTYRLNCAAASTVAPFQSEKFEMFIDIPRDAKPGPAVLVWAVDGSPLEWSGYGVYLPVVA